MARKKFTLPVAVLGGVAAAALNVKPYLKPGEQVGLIESLTFYHTPSHQFNWFGRGFATYAPLVAGFVAHMAASKLGINKALARAGIPIIRI